MKKKKDSQFEDIETLKNIDNNMIFLKQEKFNLHNLIISCFLIILFSTIFIFPKN